MNLIRAIVIAITLMGFFAGGVCVAVVAYALHIWS